MSKWKEPKNDYIAEDQVLPEIFNNLADNEIYLKENKCKVDLISKDGTESVLTDIVLVEV